MPRILKAIIQFPFYAMLRKDICITLLIKCVLLFLLWKLCFSHPLDIQLTNTDIVKHLISG